LYLAYSSAGRFDEGIRFLEETLRLRKTKFGSEDPEILNTMNMLVVMYLLGSKWDQARSLYEEILKLQKTRQGPEHPNTLTAMTNLAGNYMLPIPTQKSPEAIRLYQEVLTIQRRKLAADDSALAETLASLGFCLLYAEKP